MKELPELFQANREWAARMTADDPAFFGRLASRQRPDLLWIGCSDSRVPANEIVGRLPGEVFVHRNIANVVVHSDLNCLSVIQFAVEILEVRHIVVCGHYRCGGILAALAGARHGLVDNWLGHVRDVAMRHEEQLRGLDDAEAKADRLCELNAIEQAVNVARGTAVGDRWSAGGSLSVHGWIYDIRDGLLRDLGFCVTGPESLEAEYQSAAARPAPRPPQPA